MKFPNPLLRATALAAALLSAACCWAQSSTTAGNSTAAINAQNANNVCRIYFTKPKPGADAQYEAGRKKHMQFHRSQNDTFTWGTWLIGTGENTGTYVTSTCGHAWKDFDAWEKRMGKADTADGAINLSPSTAASWNGFYVERADVSLAAPNRPPAPMVAVTIYVLKPGAATEFIGAVTKIGDALKKLPDFPKTSVWLQLVNGGEGPAFVLLSDRQNFGDMAAGPQGVIDAVNAAYGKETGDQIFKTLRDSTAHTFTELAEYRADLSYVPGK
jgi:hypothetical protein